eukprot:5194847-Pleurochrysis_carterae.AAC.3
MISSCFAANSFLPSTSGDVSQEEAEAEAAMTLLLESEESAFDLTVLHCDDAERWQDERIFQRV